MPTTYDLNQFNEVVPYLDGRRSNDSTSYRELTGYEEQLLEEIAELKRELLLAEEKIEHLTTAKVQNGE